MLHIAACTWDSWDVSQLVAYWLLWFYVNLSYSNIQRTNFWKKLFVTKASARNNFSSLKCAKTHLRQSIFSNIVRRLNPRTPLQQGKGRKGEAREGEGRKGDPYEVVPHRQLVPGYGPDKHHSSKSLHKVCTQYTIYKYLSFTPIHEALQTI